MPRIKNHKHIFNNYFYNNGTDRHIKWTIFLGFQPSEVIVRSVIFHRSTPDQSPHYIRTDLVHDRILCQMTDSYYISTYDANPAAKYGKIFQSTDVAHTLRSFSDGSEYEFLITSHSGSDATVPDGSEISFHLEFLQY